MPSLVEPVLRPGSLARRRQPVLRTGDLVLRPWEEGDVPALVAAYADPEIQRWHARSLTEPEARQWVASRARRWTQELGVEWAVTRDRRVVARIGLGRIDLAGGLGEVVYWVAPGARGGGVASAALRALTAWALGEAGLHRLELTHSTLNPGSCRVAERCGYGLEGTKRQEALHPDGWHDMHLHARLTGDPDERREPAPR